MKRILPFLAILIASPAVACDYTTRRYATATTVDFCLYITDATVGAVKVENAAHASGDTYLMKDEAAEANTTNGFTDEGSCYSIALTSTEMTAARVTLNIEDQGTKAWADKCIVIETYGHASAQHATFDGVLASEQSGNVYYLASGAVDADDQFNNGYVIVFYDSAGLIKAKSCITDSADTNDAVTTRDDLDALTAPNDSYVIKDEALCAQIAELSSVPTTGTTGIIDQIRALYQRAIHKFVDDGTEQAAYKADGSTKLFECDVADSGSAYTRSACGTPD